uniref:plasma membrane-associated cation-binding protein 1-like n=1 Tax=Fragaria vesca subsp. vesca TaxID=101020 RepID=UPI0005C8350D|nr:PREDICTED: plasma membrane-associated cation-binding protein 1-like [Fragaria vesca subsp. vesca]
MAEKYSSAVHKVLKELAKREFPVSEASSKYGSAYVSSPVFFVLGEIIAVEWWLERDSNIMQFNGSCSLLDKRQRF